MHEGKPNELLEGRWWWVAVVVLLGAIVMEGLSFRTAIRESNKTRGAATWVEFIRRAKSPELPVILLEDFAALIGLVLALLGVGLSKLTGNGYFDVAGTAGIGLLLVAVAVVLAHRDQEPAARGGGQPGGAAAGCASGLERTDGRRAGDPHEDDAPRPGGAAGRGEDRRAPHRASAADVAASIDAAERAMREAEPTAQVIYVEPDIYVEGHRTDPRPAPPAAGATDPARVDGSADASPPARVALEMLPDPTTRH